MFTIFFKGMVSEVNDKTEEVLNKNGIWNGLSWSVFCDLSYSTLGYVSMTSCSFQLCLYGIYNLETKFQYPF